MAEGDPGGLEPRDPRKSHYTIEVMWEVYWEGKEEARRQPLRSRAEERSVWKTEGAYLL